MSPAGLCAAERGIANALLVLDRIRVRQRARVRASAARLGTPAKPASNLRTLEPANLSR